jgi:hypothetical protein
LELQTTAKKRDEKVQIQIRECIYQKRKGTEVKKVNEKAKKKGEKSNFYFRVLLLKYFSLISA